MRCARRGRAAASVPVELARGARGTRAVQAKRAKAWRRGIYVAVTSATAAVANNDVESAARAEDGLAGQVNGQRPRRSAYTQPRARPKAMAWLKTGLLNTDATAIWGLPCSCYGRCRPPIANTIAPGQRRDAQDRAREARRRRRPSPGRRPSHEANRSNQATVEQNATPTNKSIVFDGIVSSDVRQYSTTPMKPPTITRDWQIATRNHESEVAARGVKSRHRCRT